MISRIPSLRAWRRTADRFSHDESGASAIEYAILGSMIALVLVTAITALGTRLSGVFSNTSGAF